MDEKGLTSWQIANEVLEYIEQKVDGESKTLETGSGLTTILIASKGAEHICITPDQGEVDRIRAYCEQRGIPLDKVSFRVDFSERVLPYLKLEDLDLILIDGGHGFPTPFIDWYYTAMALKVGGTLIIDNTELWTGDVLRRFLEAEAEWRLDKHFQTGFQTHVFRKAKEYQHKDWCYQRYVVRNSDLAALSECMDISWMPGADEWRQAMAEKNSLQSRNAGLRACSEELPSHYGAPKSRRCRPDQCR
jgi:hypothetical protein